VFWNLGDIHNFSWAPLVIQMIVLALFKDKQFWEGEDYNVPFQNLGGRLISLFGSRRL
jgi:hypothetical protein